MDATSVQAALRRGSSMRCNIAWQPSRKPWRSGPTVGDFSGAGSSSLKERCVPRHRSKGRSASSICPRPANLLHQRKTVHQSSDKQEWAGSHPRKPSPISLRVRWRLEPSRGQRRPSARTIAQAEHPLRPSRTHMETDVQPSPQSSTARIAKLHTSLNSEESSCLRSYNSPLVHSRCSLGTIHFLLLVLPQWQSSFRGTSMRFPSCSVQMFGPSSRQDFRRSLSCLGSTHICSGSMHFRL